MTGDDEDQGDQHHLTEVLKAAIKERGALGAVLAQTVPRPAPAETHVIHTALAAGWNDLDPGSN